MKRDYDSVLRAEDILSYGQAVATERATYAAACAWHAFSDQYRAQEATMHPMAEMGLGHKVQDAIRNAEDAHREAEVALQQVPLHFRLFDPSSKSLSSR